MEAIDYTPEQREAVDLVDRLLIERRARLKPRPRQLREKPWGPLSAPVDPEETRLRAQAQSYLSGSLLTSERCPAGICPPLTIDQARDVLRWAGRLPA